MPRKSYREYQADIYPDTPGPVAAMGPLDWLQGGQMAPARISLNPAKRQAAGGSLAKHGPPLSEIPRQMLGKAATAVSPKSTAAATTSNSQAGITNGIGGHSPKFSTNQSNGTASKMAATESTNNELVVQINTTENVETSTNTSQAR